MTTWAKELLAITESPGKVVRYARFLRIGATRSRNQQIGEIIRAVAALDKMGKARLDRHQCALCKATQFAAVRCIQPARDRIAIDGQNSAVIAELVTRRGRP
jgi:hypothetical protein